MVHGNDRERSRGRVAKEPPAVRWISASAPSRGNTCPLGRRAARARGRREARARGRRAEGGRGGGRREARARWRRGPGGVRRTRSSSRYISNCVPLTKESVRPREGSPGGYGHPADKTHKEDKANEVTKVLPTTVNIAYASIAPPHPKPLQIAT